jgi:[acyl-carrier-protein] S-malonyltransferase
VQGGVAWLFPGQGSQVVGMGHDLLAQFAPARAAMARVSELAGLDLATLAARGPDEALTRTDNLQPALTAVTVGCCLYLRQSGLRPDFVAGHSLGEYAALFAAGVISLDDALLLTTLRGRLMHEVAETLQGGMLAVNDLPAERAEAVLATLEPAGSVTVANQNAPNQIALCGPLAALPDAAAALTAAGARVVPLNVSGPWHSPLLAPAADRFAAHLDSTAFHDAAVPVALNATGRLESSGEAIRAAMRRQLCSPVRWNAAMLSLHAAGASRFVELGPKKVLRGLLRHIPSLAECEAVNFDGPRALRFVQKLYPAQAA